MKYLITAGAILAASISGAVADLCADGSVDDNGNWYCQPVDSITYTGLAGSGSYNKVSNMDSNSGACSSNPYGYSGSMSPLDEEVSLHFRGPLKIKQFAFFSPSSDTPDSSSSKAKRSVSHRHAHAHAHAHAHKAKRGVGDWITAVIDGQTVSWINEWSGAATTAATSAPTTIATSTAVSSASTASTTFKAMNHQVNGGSSYESSSGSSSESSSAAVAESSTSSSSSAASSSSSSSSSGSWGQKAYYNSQDGTADNVVFLNHNGGSGSGVFDYTFGNSLSYASTDGASGASSPQILSDTQLDSNVEVIIMSDKECDGDCGYVRDGTVAYHGFSGAQKAFFFEFEMPLDGNTDASTNGDMPAIWMLNAQIPRTLQYGQSDCSCWTTGCGEFDIFEVLAPGDLRCKSTLHGNINGGDSDYFKRPTSGTMKAIVVMNGENIHIKTLDSDYEVPSSIDASFISNICESTLIQSTLISLFELVSK